MAIEIQQDIHFRSFQLCNSHHQRVIQVLISPPWPSPTSNHVPGSPGVQLGPQPALSTRCLDTWRQGDWQRLIATKNAMRDSMYIDNIISMYIYIYINISIKDISIYINIYIYTYIYIFYILTHIYMCMCLYIYIYIHIPALCMYIYILHTQPKAWAFQVALLCQLLNNKSRTTPGIYELPWTMYHDPS